MWYCTENGALLEQDALDALHLKNVQLQSFNQGSLGFGKYRVDLDLDLESAVESDDIGRLRERGQTPYRA